jgi:hypothetical protein
MDDEPLSEWVKRHDMKMGQLRAAPLVPGKGLQGAHLNPDAPRVIERWNGHIWEFYGFAVNLAEAQRILYPDNKVAPASGSAPKLGPGTGRHRKPQAPR